MTSETRIAEEQTRRELPVAQFLRLQSQIPPLYLLVTANAIALAFFFRSAAPPWLSLGVPAILIIAVLARRHNWRIQANRPLPDIEQARRRLRQTLVFAAVFSAAFLAWALALDQFPAPNGHAAVFVFIALTMLGGILCLGYLPIAANIATNGTLVLLAGEALMRGSLNLAMATANLAVVANLMLKLMRDSFASFVELETSKTKLELRQQHTQLLSEENSRLALSDALTSLPNRRYFFSRLEALLARPGGPTFVIGIIDLDGFKPINDTLGHAQGDRLLGAIADRLQELCSEEVMIARLGGDEFGMIVDAGIKRAEELTHAICSTIQRPVVLGETSVALGCSAGLAAYPEMGTTAESLFDRADFALYYAKEHRRGTCVRFSEELERLNRSELALEAALQSADLSTELDLVFQPIFSTQTLAPVAVEALARWSSPTLGTVPPGLLISTAERVGRTRSVTLTLFDKALEALAVLPSPVRLSFNLGAQDLADRETIDAILSRTRTNGIDSSRLYFEITETSLVSDLSGARSALGQLRSCGAGIALDDFGTGYSSLSMLHELPIDKVKIDRSFAAQIDDPSGRRLLGAIRDLTRSLALECIVEGIETERQFMEAGLAGFAYVQGYFLARPDTLEATIERCLVPPGPKSAAIRAA